MVSKSKGKQEDNLEVVEHALTNTEHFIEQNQRTITIALIAIVAVVGIFLGYKRFIVSPKEKEAQSQMFAAEQYFEKDSFNLALNGDGNYLGFLDIIDQYKVTRSAKLAHYYSGISYLKLGKFQDAIDQLKKFTLKDEMVSPISKGAIGDAYSELGRTDEAVDYYMKAARMRPNNFVTPIYLMKAGELLEANKEYTKAIPLYKEIQKDYPESNEGRKIEKYIARAEAGLVK
ncbi:MAG: tetratricopeptide repeat protein [Porphyromonadaceae bacterium]|nr:MAG: tetratricopeptide repeat protein [Porphyromonadaceae bacterium]